MQIMRLLKMMEQLFTQADNAALRNFSHFNYAAEPFVNQLKSTNDPRGKVHVSKYAESGCYCNTILTRYRFS